MVNYITFGEYNKNYIFIFLLIFFSILNSNLFDIIIDIFLYYKVISSNVKYLFYLISSIVKYLFYHEFIINIPSFLGMFLFSCIINKYENILSKRDLNSSKFNISKSEKGCFKNIKINEEKKAKLNNRKNLLNILITIIISIFIDIFLKINSILNVFNYWMFFLLINNIFYK